MFENGASAAFTLPMKLFPSSAALRLLGFAATGAPPFTLTFTAYGATVASTVNTANSFSPLVSGITFENGPATGPQPSALACTERQCPA